MLFLLKPFDRYPIYTDVTIVTVETSKIHLLLFILINPKQ
jgi:hypothetical protein